MREKTEIVKQYEQRKAAGESLYFDPVEIDELYHYYEDQCNEEEIEAVLRLARELHPNDVVTLTIEAEHHLNLDEAEECLRILNPVFDPDNLLHNILRSAASARVGKLTDALVCAERAMEYEDPNVAYDLGYGFMRADEPMVALRYFGRCLDAYPDDIRTLIGMLYCLHQVGTPEEILQYADRAIEIDSYCFEAWTAKGSVYQDRGQWKEAEECFDYALAIDPENPECMIMKAQCCLETNRGDEAVQLALEAAQHADAVQQANVYFFVARAMHDRGKKKEASDYVWKALLANPGNLVVMEHAAVDFSEYDDPESAITLLKEIYRQQGDEMGTPLLAELAEQYVKLDMSEEALKLYDVLLKRNPSPSIYTMMAGTYMALSKFRKAYKLLEKANELEEVWQAHLLMAVCAHELGWNSAMKDHYAIAYFISADDAQNMLKAISPRLGLAFEDLKVFEYAVEWREKYMKTSLKNIVKDLQQLEKERKMAAEQNENNTNKTK